MDDNSRRCAAVLAMVLLFGCGCSHGQPGRSQALTASKQPTSRPLELNDNQSLEIQFALARTLEHEGSLDRAAEVYRQILLRDPAHAEATHRLAIVYGQQGLFDESTPLFARALELKPANVDLFCDVGYSFYRQRQWSQAEANFRQALALEPNHKRARNHVGLVLAVTNREDDALQEFYKSGCTLAEARMNIALMHSLESRFDQARNNYRLALQADPKSKLAQARLREVDAVIARAEAANSSSAELAQNPPVADSEAVVPGNLPANADAQILRVGYEQ